MTNKLNDGSGASTIGEIAFAAYVKEVGGIAYDGTEIPKWMMLKPGIRSAWEAAAFAVRVADQGMRTLEEVQERLNLIVLNLADFVVENELDAERSIWLYKRGSELVWALRLTPVGGEVVYLQGLVEAERAKKKDE